MRTIQFSLMPILFAVIAGIAFNIALTPTALHAQSTVDSGLITTQSATNVDDTVTKLTTALEEGGLRLMTVIDHSANAANVDQDLRPTQLMIFGNPNSGTQLMQNNRTVGIDLPQKYLVWEDVDGQVFVTYNSAAYLAARHGLTGPQAVLDAVAEALANFVNLVAMPVDGPPPTTLPVTGRGAQQDWVLAGLLFLLVSGGAGILLLRRTWRRRLWMGALAMGIVLSSGLYAGLASAQLAGDDSLRFVTSPYSVAETVTNLQREIEARGLRVMTTVDHAANAASVERELPPTQLLLFGNPNIGTGLMQRNQTIGIDLPQKFLVWEDDTGTVQIAYDNPAYLGARHKIVDADEVLENIAGALAAITAAATQ